MKLLLDINKVVVNAGNYDYNYVEDGVEVIAGQRVQSVLSGYDSANSEIIDLPEGTELPDNTIGFYKYVDGKFLKNNQRIPDVAEEVATLVELMTSELPKIYTPEIIKKKVDKKIEIWQALIRNEKLKYTEVPEDYRQGILIIDTPDEDLTEAQIINKKKAVALRNDLTARYRIEAQVGNIYSQVADVDKKVDATKTMDARSFLLIKNLYEHLELPIPEAIVPSTVLPQYSTYANSVNDAVIEGEYSDRTDLEDPTELQGEQMRKNMLKKQIIKEEIKDKEE